MRVAIIGNSGSGKSTLARQIGERIGVVPIDLDGWYWEPDQPGVPRNLDVVELALREALALNASWVIEGCYDDLVGRLLDLAPRLLWLEPGREACLERCRARPWESHKYPSKTAQDRNLPMLLDWIADYYERDGPMSFRAHRRLFDGYDGDKELIRK